MGKRRKASATGAIRAARRAAFTAEPTGPNQVWQLDFPEVETTRGGAWRSAGVADYGATYEFGWPVAATQHGADAVAALHLAVTEATELRGRPLADAVTDPATGEIRPVVVVTDHGPTFKKATFARRIAGVDRPPSARVGSATSI